MSDNNNNKGVLVRKLRGFTLIEMVIVILLVGIMAAIAIPKFVNLTTTAKQAAYDSGLGSLKSAVGIYLGENQGIWPTPNSVTAAMEGTVTCVDNNATYGGIDTIEIADIEGVYEVTVATCDSQMTQLGEIAVYTSVF